MYDASDGLVVERTWSGASVRERIEVPAAKQWSPDTPHLYRLHLELRSAVTPSDHVQLHTGLRTLEVRDQRICLNGRPLLLKMILVQGYYPGGHSTALHTRDYATEIALYKEMGFNGVRIHEKIEDPRFFLECDKQGLLVWEEMPSPFLFSLVDEDAYHRELLEVLARDNHHPSVMALVLFNETWGIFDVLWSKNRRQFIRRMYDLAKQENPHRLSWSATAFSPFTASPNTPSKRSGRSMIASFGHPLPRATWACHLPSA